MPSISLITTLAATASLGLAATADAGTFCVGDVPGCPADSVPLASALAEAQATDGHDEVLIGPGTFSAGSGFKYETDDPANTIRIRGAGPQQTTIAPSTSTKSATFATLKVKAAGPSVVEELGVSAAGEADDNAETRGLALYGPVTASHVRVLGGVPAPSQGVVLDGATLLDSIVVVPSDAPAVDLDGIGTSTVQRSHLDARIGVRNHVAGPAQVYDTRIDADLFGIVNDGGANVTAADVAIRVMKPGGIGLRARAADGGAKIVASHVTIQGAVSGTIGASVYADDGNDGSISLDNSIVADVATGASRYSDGAGSDASVTLHTVNYDQSNDESTGPSGAISRTAIRNLDPHFADAAAGDLRLLRTSPLLDDAREPAFVDPGLLAINGPRKVGSTADLGAFEHQHNAPTAAMEAPEGIVAGVPVTLSAEKSTANDPGDKILSWSWSFGDGSPNTTGTPTPTHTFAVAGTYTLQLTVSDLDGKLGTVKRTVVVAPALVAERAEADGPLPAGEPTATGGTAATAPTGAGGVPVAPADRLAPVITGLRRRGRAVTFSLSEAGTVTVRIEKRRGVRTFRAAAAKKLAGRAGRNRVAIRRLRPGRYRAVVIATDAAGNRSVKRRAFRVAR
ncbi:MAG TPA: PKD domain-containing protein [Solirubrobacteraceae bacterium]|jgi:hypothetical protein